MKMDDKKLQALAEELNSFSVDTLKYFYWTVRKLCTVIELSSNKEGVEYKLQPRNEERDTKNGVPTPEQEAKIMQGLQKQGFFEFQSAWLGADKPIIFGGEHGITGEEAIRMATDPRSELEMKYEWGWLENPDLDALQNYLTTISSLASPSAKKVLCRFENKTFFLTLKDGTEKPITFETRRDTNYMLMLFQVIYEHWQRFGREPLERAEVRRRMKKKGVTREISDDFINDTVSNIRQKVNAVGLSDCVVIDYDKIIDGWYLDIQVPS